MATEVSYDVPQGLPDPGMLLIAAQRVAALSEPSERSDAVGTLFKLIDGILASPEEPKKRRVRKSNEVFHRKVGRHGAALEFLRAAGFVDGDDPDTPGEAGRNGLLSMPVAYMSRITDAHHALARCAQEAGLPAPALPTVGGEAFNPYASNRQAVDSANQMAANNQWKTEADRIREEVKRKEKQDKEKVEQAAPVDLKASAFWLSAGRRLEEIIREANELNPSEDRATDNAILVEQLSHVKNALQGTSNFESADKRRLQELSRKRVHQHCILRIICPDKSCLQVHFRAADKGEHVLTQIKPLLAPEIREAGWYIYQTPPLRKLNPKETLLAAGLSPGANMYLGFESSTKPAAPYLEASLVAQMGPPPEAQRGCGSFGAPLKDGPTFSGEAMGWGGGQALGGAPKAAEAPAASAAAAPAEDAGPVPMQEG
eukprot:TRINITY_DN121553_c0_g1_i1.p1 TRINITY_DN121553_c0_g1~~TRINITY_DN121553_c0_g1_i1.p1  ORF type:complete len:429 (-),score=99.67 TRINITY_DN121553_c0_g1_i1:65-1351(-)